MRAAETLLRREAVIQELVPKTAVYTENFMCKMEPLAYQEEF